MLSWKSRVLGSEAVTEAELVESGFDGWLLLRSYFVAASTTSTLQNVGPAAGQHQIPQDGDIPSPCPHISPTCAELGLAGSQ